jgi:uncharacterized Tic20 family protein
MNQQQPPNDPAPDATSSPQMADPLAEPAAQPVPASSEDKTMGMLCHLLALAGYVIPFGNIIGPLIIWLIKKDESAFVDDQGKESLNFQITVTIAILVCIPLMLVLIGIILMPVIAIAALILVIVATVSAAGGTAYRYPMTIRLIK